MLVKVVVVVGIGGVVEVMVVVVGEVVVVVVGEVVVVVVGEVVVDYPILMIPSGHSGSAGSWIALGWD